MWVKPFQNMRASCAVDLNRQGYAQHTVAHWMGHSDDIAFKHFLRTTDEEFSRAAGLLLEAPEGGEAEPEADSAGQRRTRRDTATGFVRLPTKNATHPRECVAWSAPPLGLEPRT